jgi:hypothetical protein
MLRPHLDIIMLPGNHAPTKEAWLFYKQELGLCDDQVVFTPGGKFNMDDDMDALTCVELGRRMKHGGGDADRWLLLPYKPTQNFHRWADPLVAQAAGSVSVYGETSDWLAKFGDKGLLHRRMDALDMPSVIETIDPTIAVPRGYVCATIAELLAARELMADLADVCIKPLCGATGEGIVLKPTRADLAVYDFGPMGPVNLEEYLELDLDERGEAVSPVLHYMGPALVGDFMLDQIMVGCEYMGWQKTAVSDSFVDESMRVMHKFLQHAQPAAAGGVDFLSVAGRPLLTDMNTGRFNGAHPSKVFFQAHAPAGWEYYCWKTPMAKHLPGVQLQTVWERLKARGLAYALGADGQGVFPLIGVRGIRLQFIAIAPDTEALHELVRATNEIMDELKAEAQAPAARQHLRRSPGLDICAICLAAPDGPVELSCGHGFCGRCLLTAASTAHAKCPVCRVEHLLDPLLLRQRLQAFRAAYGGWRRGEGKGAKGEVGHVTHIDAVTRRVGKLGGLQAVTVQKLVHAEAPAGKWANSVAYAAESKTLELLHCMNQRVPTLQLRNQPEAEAHAAKVHAMESTPCDSQDFEFSSR